VKYGFDLVESYSVLPGEEINRLSALSVTTSQFSNAGVVGVPEVTYMNAETGQEQICECNNTCI